MHGFDAATPIDETLYTLDNFVRSGKVRYIACSNFSGWHLMKSLAVSERYGWARYVGHQVYYSLIGRDYEWELMPLALDQKVGALVWSPLGWGRLTGKIRRGQPLPEGSRLHKTAQIGPQPPDEYLYKVVDAIDGVAKETGKSVPQIALNWLLQRPTVATVIVGARNEEQLRQNLDAATWNLTAEQVARLDAASKVARPYPYWHQAQFAERNPLPVIRTSPEHLHCLGFLHLLRCTQNDIGPSRRVDDDDAPVREGFDRMPDISQDDGNQACPGDLRHAVDGHLKLTLDHLVDLFLGMEVLVNGGAAREIVVRKRHTRRVEIASQPAGQALYNIQAVGVDEGHQDFP